MGATGPAGPPAPPCFGPYLPVPLECPDDEFVFGFWWPEPESREIQPGADCPCFDGSTIAGQGIDHAVEMLTEANCWDDPDHLGLGGYRADGSYWWARVVTFIHGGPGCTFFDESIDHSVWSVPLTPTQHETCLQVVLESEVFALNACPGDP